jgi:hypothetical protein
MFMFFMYIINKMLNIFELNRKKDEREIKKYNTYNQILSKCHTRIQLSSERDLQYCVYNIPNFVAGLPTYDSIKCADYIIENLRKNGFKVMYGYPNILYISWTHIPSNITNPYVKKIETDMMVNPYKDYSKDINMISHLTTEVSSPRHHNVIADDKYDIKALITRPFKF